jgi:hypothetical protein
MTNPTQTTSKNPGLHDTNNDGIQDITHKMFNMMSSGGKADAFPVKSIDGGVDIAESSTAEKLVIPALEASTRHVKTFDKFWAKELYEVSYEDREAIMYEMHGVESRAVPETPEMIRSSLKELEVEISVWLSGNLSQQQRSIFKSFNETTAQLTRGHLLAVEKLHSQYVVSPEFRIRFLRTEFFDVPKAAFRYFRCLNQLLFFFGEASLQRPLRIEDLTDSEREFLESGKIQCLSSRDKLGRRILVVYGGMLTSYPLFERCKVELYLIWGVMAEDEESQRHGIIALVLFDLKGGGSAFPDEESANTTKTKNSRNSWDGTEKRVFHRLSRQKYKVRTHLTERAAATPVRNASIHLCMPGNRIYTFLGAIFRGIIPSAYRSIVKISTGSHLEVGYELQRFGIPVDDLPSASSKGIVIRTKSLARFLKARANIDSFRKEHAQKHGVEYHWPSCTTVGSSQNKAINNDDKPSTDGRAAEASAFHPEFCPGTDCPESNCVVFGDRLTYKYATNIAFRDYLRAKEKCLFRSDASSDVSLRLSSQVLDQLIRELCAINDVDSSSGATTTIHGVPKNGFRFATYDKITEWYRYIDPIHNTKDRLELRKKISQAMRDERKRTKSRTKRSHQQAASAAAAQPPPPKSTAIIQQQEDLEPLSFRNMTLKDTTNEGMPSSMDWINASTVFGIENYPYDDEFFAKRFKRDHSCWKGW